MRLKARLSTFEELDTFVSIHTVIHHPQNDLGPEYKQR